MVIERNLTPKRCLTIVLPILALALAIFSAQFNVFTASLSSTFSEDHSITQSGSVIINGTDTFILANGTFTLNETIIVEDFAKLIIENATVMFNTTDYIVIRSYNNALITITDSEISHAQGSQLHLMHFSVMSVTNSRVDILISYNSANASMKKSTFDVVHAYGSSVVSITDAKIRFIGGHEVSLFSIVDSTVNTVYTSDNAIVSIDNCTVSGLVDIYSSSTISIENSTLNQVCIYGSSTISVNNSTAEKIVATASTFVSVVNSTIDWFSPRKALIVNSTLFEINLYFYGDVNASLNPLPIGLVDYWNVLENNTVVKAPYYWNVTESITIKKSQVGGWDITGYGSPVVWVANSTICDVVAYFSSFISLFNSEILNDITTHSSSVVRLVNSTLHGSIYVEAYPENYAKVIVGWYLDVRAMNINGSPLSGSLVKAYWQNGTLLAFTTTNEDGRARLILYEKLVNVTGTFTYTNYTLEVSYKGYTIETLIESINGNMEITVTFPVIPDTVSGKSIILRK